MSLTSAELKKLLLPLTMALVLLSAGIGLIFLVESRLASAQSQLAAATQEKNTHRERLARISEEEREVKENIAIYRRLADARILGVEKRLEWIDSIQRIRTSRELLDVRYRIDPQRILNTVPGKPEGIDFNVSSMRVDLALLHEGDLLSFLRDLRDAGNAYVSVKQCSISRTGASATIQPGTTLAPRLRADCLIDLITILDRGAKK